MEKAFELNKALFEAVAACNYGLQNATLTIRDPKSKKTVWTLSI